MCCTGHIYYTELLRAVYDNQVLKKMKGKPQAGRKYLQIIHQTKGYYLEFEKDSYNSTTKTKNNLIKKWAKNVKPIVYFIIIYL